MKNEQTGIYYKTMGYCSVLKRKAVLVSATTWIHVEDTVPNEISQIQKNKYCMISVI